MGKGDYVDLHQHSTYSFMDGHRQVRFHAERAAELGRSALAMTEHGNVTSHAKLEQAAKEFGLTPIYGLEAYTGAVDEARSQSKWHLTVLAADAGGYQNLLRMTTEAWADGFYYYPTVSGDSLARHSDGLVVLSGCLGSKLATDLIGGKGRPMHPEQVDLDIGLATAARFKDLLGDRYYLETQAFPELGHTRIVNQVLEEIGRRLSIPLVATCDVHYPQAEDNEIQRVLHAIGRGSKTIAQMDQNWEYDIRLCPRKPGAVRKRLLATGLSARAVREAMASSVEIAARCRVELPRLARLRYPGARPAAKELALLLNEGWLFRKFDQLPEPVVQRYIERVDLERGLITEQDFIDYFLVVAEMVKFAKDRGIAVGPSRGTASASLVCYLLRITEVNPMHYPNLLFSRFIDPHRHDMPDIDLDFDDARRSEVFAHAVEVYGADRVGNVMTVTAYRGKNSIDDVGRIHRIPMAVVEEAKSMTIFRSGGDPRAEKTIEDSRDMFPRVKELFERYPALNESIQLEGNLRGFAVHAAGLVVSAEPLTNSCAVYTRRDAKGTLIGTVLSLDKYDCEYVGALKIDLLGLTTMGVIGNAMAMLGLPMQSLYDLPMDDDRVYERFRAGKLTGVFQFDGRAVANVCHEVQPSSFDELCDIVALARPGPLHSRATAKYGEAKHGRLRVPPVHPIYDEITGPTHGQVVYQEQILRLVRELAGFSWEEASRIRRLISKKQGEQAFQREVSRFIEGCKEQGLDEETATDIWQSLVTSGAYAFNYGHSVGYATIAYWCAYLQTYHLLEFTCAALQKATGSTHKDKQAALLKEADAAGLAILPPDPVHSVETWWVQDGALRAGLMQIPGIGPTTGPGMVAYREANEVRGWRDYQGMSGIGPITMQKVEAWVSRKDPFDIHTLENKLVWVRRWLWEHGDEYGLPVARHKTIDVPYEPGAGNYTWVGRVTVRNVTELYEAHRVRTGRELDPTTVREPQYTNWGVLTGVDETGSLAITVHRFGGLWERVKDDIMGMDLANDLLLVAGYKIRQQIGRRGIFARQVWIIKPGTISAGAVNEDWS